MPQHSTPPAIILAAFGTSVLKGMKLFEFVDAAARARYPDHEIRWAFTSGTIGKRLKDQGVVTRGVEEVLEQLAEGNHQEAAVQPLHVAPGQEYARLCRTGRPGMRLAVGRPLLSGEDDVRRVIEAVAAEVRHDATNVLVLHGSNRRAEYNRQNLALARAMESEYDNLFAASLEGQPGTAPLEAAGKHAARTGWVHFIPIMLVAVGHVLGDVMGDRDDSWKNIVAAEVSTCASALGYNRSVLEIYFDHLDEALGQLPGNRSGSGRGPG